MPDLYLLSAGARLHHWLLSRVVESDGGVIGSFEIDGSARYLYPEIAGYYLSWLVWLNSVDRAPADLPLRGAAIANWLQRWQLTQQQTRPAPSAGDDWRNRGVFAFDLAMLLRGLAAAKSHATIETTVADQLSAELVAQLSRLLDKQGRLLPVLVLRGQLPQRWSTSCGPYQAKVGAALLLAARQFPLPSVLVMAASRLLQSAADDAQEPIHADNAHAAMYALEGLTTGVALRVLPAATGRSISAQLDGWRALVQSALDEGSAPAAEFRHDVLAQWLRLARIHRPDDGLITAAESTLRAAIAADGSLAFAAAPFDQGPCTWAAIFAHQALWPQPIAAEYLL